MQKLSKSNRMRILYAGIILLGIALDQLTKQLAAHLLTRVMTVPLIKGVLHLTYVENRGAAWGMLANHRWVFMLFSTIAILAIGAYLFRGISYLSDKREDGSYPPIPSFGGIALALIVSGGIGNMIDRIALGYVVDFIDFRLINFPVFNGADCFVTVGAFMLALYLILSFKPKKKKSE